MDGYKIFISAPTLIAISRTCDYHHHYQDVVIGSAIGFALAYICYRLYYPRLSSQNSDLPYEYILDVNNDERHLGSVLPLYSDPIRSLRHQKYTPLKQHNDTNKP